MEEQACRSCGETNPTDARLCGMCGAPVLDDEAAGEVHREVTLVTSDLKGSTALGERLDPEALREVLNRYFDVMRAVFESHGGTIEKIIGDAIVAVFGLPFRHEDDPLRAVEAAAETQRALATLNVELELGWGVQLVNRTGISTGGVTFGRAEGGQHVLLGEPSMSPPSWSRTRRPRKSSSPRPRTRRWPTWSRSRRSLRSMRKARRKPLARTGWSWSTNGRRRSRPPCPRRGRGCEYAPAAASRAPSGCGCA